MVSRLYSRRPAENYRRLALLPLAFCCFCLSVVAVAAVPALSGQDGVSGGAEPIVITAGSLIADNKKKVVVYKTGVVVKRGDVTLYADEVVVQLDDAGERGKPSGSEAGDLFSGPGKVDTIRAAGGVKIVQGDKTATAGEALYNTGSESITLTGEPRLWQGLNVLTGSAITFNIAEDTFVVENAKTVLYQEKGGPQGPGALETP